MLAFFYVICYNIYVERVRKKDFSTSKKAQGGKKMAGEINLNAEDGEKMLSAKTLGRLLDYLRNVAQWSDSQIVDLLEFLTSK